MMMGVLIEGESTTWAWGEDKGNGIVVKGWQKGNEERKRIRSPNAPVTLAKSQPHSILKFSSLW